MLSGHYFFPVDHNFLDCGCIRCRLNKSRESTLHPINADINNKFRFDKLRSGQLGNAARWRATYKGRRSRVAGAWTSVRIPTFNVNDINKWLPNVLHWLDEIKPDVVCLQELKKHPPVLLVHYVAECGLLRRLGG